MVRPYCIRVIFRAEHLFCIYFVKVGISYITKPGVILKRVYLHSISEYATTLRAKTSTDVIEYIHCLLTSPWNQRPDSQVVIPLYM